MTIHQPVDRYSVEPGDAGETNYWRLREQSVHIAVWLDGVEQFGVLTADRAEGFVKRTVKPFRIDGDEIATETVRGKVEFNLITAPTEPPTEPRP